MTFLDERLERVKRAIVTELERQRIYKGEVDTHALTAAVLHAVDPPVAPANPALPAPDQKAAPS